MYTLQTSNTTHTHPARHTPQALNQTQAAHNNSPEGGAHRQALVLAVKEPKPNTAHSWGHHTHTGALSIMLTRHSNPISLDFLPISQGGAAVL